MPPFTSFIFLFTSDRFPLSFTDSSDFTASGSSALDLYLYIFTQDVSTNVRCFFSCILLYTVLKSHIFTTIAFYFLFWLSCKFSLFKPSGIKSILDFKQTFICSTLFWYFHSITIVIFYNISGKIGLKTGKVLAFLKYLFIFV